MRNHRKSSGDTRIKSEPPHGVANAVLLFKITMAL